MLIFTLSFQVVLPNVIPQKPTRTLFSETWKPDRIIRFEYIAVHVVTKVHEC